MDYLAEQQLEWHYMVGGEYEGEMIFLIVKDDLEVFAVDLLQFMAAVSTDPYFLDNYGCISVSMDLYNPGQFYFNQDKLPTAEEIMEELNGR